jgi:hypothetical protein
MTKDEVNGVTFQEWLEDLDLLCCSMFGIGISDGDDFLSYECWESGMTINQGLDVWCDTQDLDPREFGC